jgi:hypothetical protein
LAGKECGAAADGRAVLGADAFRFDAIASRLKHAGDVFASEVEVIAGQRFGEAESFAHRFQK